MTGFFHTHGPRLVESYDIVPIEKGTKRPASRGWTATDYGALLATPRGSRMYSGSGVGVKTKDTPAVDIDSPSEWLVGKIADYCSGNIGPTIARIGQAPRQLLVYRTEAPFKKLKSDTWVSPDGNEHKVEILGDGQQFVAYAIHPGTGKPYYWPDRELIDTPRQALSLITQKHAFALIDFFNTTCKAARWTRKVIRQMPVVRRPAVDPHAPLPLLRAAMSVMSIYPEAYDRWIAIGAALYHATDGSAEGLELWDTWSRKSDTYDGAAYGKWPTFGSRPGAGAGTVFYWADQSDRGWRHRPDVAALFEAYRTSRQTLAENVRDKKIRVLLSRIRNERDQDDAR
ncbi:PriCT-2 domain-containing protein [Mesorhizobium sp.]|uniref:PriCT-2 domain-containing protein n=1 Tax=Mesorhizobium sp. TaxID=1871066 RepID=UPI0025E60F4A|nr:PriCT-2 domain-containing protein [Mesorhizobium sp.]